MSKISWLHGTVIPAFLVVLGLGLGFGLSWTMRPAPAEPAVAINHVGVETLPTFTGDVTRLRITTRYENTGCSSVLLTRFLLNTKPTPSAALPQQQGPAVLPADEDEYVEEVTLSFELTEGTWHLFSVASCYLDGEPIPAAVVAPTALFDVES